METTNTMTNMKETELISRCEYFKTTSGNPDYVTNQYNTYQRFMHYPRFEKSITCSCCGKSMTREDLYTRDIMNEDSTLRGYHLPTVSRVVDDEGIAWRSFCKTCWEDVTTMSDEEIYNTYPASEYTMD